MGVYEEKQRKEREALDEQFKALAVPLADRLLQEIEKATGEKLKKSVQDGSHTISLWIDEPRISIQIEHDWGTGRYHHNSQPLGKPKILLQRSGYRRPGTKSHYRPGKDGEFNLKKIVEIVTEDVEGYRTGEKARQDNEVKRAENEAAKAKELDGLKLQDGVVVSRNYGPDTYTFRFGGTFSGLTVQDVAALSESFKKLTAQYKFEKSWRMDY